MLNYLLKHTCKFTGIILSLLCLSRILIADVLLQESDPGGMIISYRPSKPCIDSLYINEKIYHIFSYDNHSYRNPIGTPLIPTETVYFAAPYGITPIIEISELSASTLPNVILAPNPRLSGDSGGFATSIYEEDPTSYAMSGYKPDSFTVLGEKNVIDGIAIWEIMLTPVLFDARKSSIAISDSFNVNISFGSQNIMNTPKSRLIPDYVINHEAFSLSIENILMKKADIVENPFATGEWYRIVLSDNGIYSISGTELKEAGFNTGNVGSNEIHMYYGGGRTLEIEQHIIKTDDFREIAIKIKDIDGDGIIDINDKIIFYGEALSRFILDPETERPEYQNHPYAEIGEGENVFWLVVSNQDTPKRIESTGEIPSDNITPNTTYRELIHIEPERYSEWIDENNIISGINWYWETISNETEQFSFNAPGIVSSDSVIVRLGFRNGMSIVSFRGHKTIKLHKTHDLGIKVNNETFNRYINTDKTKYVDIVLFNPINSENNIIDIWLKNVISEENIRLDWLELDYGRELRLNNNKLECFKIGKDSPEKFTVSNATTPSIEIYDTTDPFHVQEVENSFYDRSSSTITFQSTIPYGKTYRYTMSAPDNYLNVSSISKKARTNLRSSDTGADYIIITHKDFKDQAIRLANWRSRDSKIDPLTTMVVDVDDIYDEFGWGIFDPAAIRDFLKFAWKNYNPRVRYCCFFGDTTSKYKNLSENQIGKNFIPTYTTIDFNKGLTTDDYFTWFDFSRIPFLSIGRLCANDIESARILVDKIIEYESNPESGIWHNRMLWIADDEYVFQGATDASNSVFTKNNEDLDSGDYVPQSFDRKKLLLIEYPLKNLRKPEATEDLLAAINDGYLMVNFIGHGNNDVLAHEHILRGSRDIERFNNGARQPLFLVFSCSVGEFDKPDNISLAEMLHLRKDGGCIAAIAAARFTYNNSNVNLNKSFYKNLFDREKNPDCRIGLALQLGKAKHNTDKNSYLYVLFGDPATRLMCPRYSFNLAEVDTVYRLQKIDIHGSIKDNLNTIPYEGTLHIKAHGPKIHKTYTNNDIVIDYTIPGKIFYNGEIDISGESFDASFIVPKDLSSDISESKDFKKESKILFFATGENTEASAVLDNFYVGGIDPEAPADNTGPEILLSFDGKSFNDGDYIRRQPTLSAEIIDNSGINILGSRGHNIKLLVDKTEAIVLTDRFKSTNSYTSGIVEYKLPVLFPGEHTFEFNAYDSYNNASKKSVTANVVGSETGDVTILNLLNYPNPMSSNGTTFTFSLNDDVRYAEIKIYSQSGRLVDTIKFNGEYGFNRINWKPPVILANGVYFYKITVRSINGRKSSKIEKLVVMR